MFWLRWSSSVLRVVNGAVVWGCLHHMLWPPAHACARSLHKAAVWAQSMRPCCVGAGWV